MFSSPTFQFQKVCQNLKRLKYFKSRPAAATHTDATTVVMTLSKTRTPSWISTPVCESSCDKNDMLLNKGANQRVVADGLGSTVVSTSLGENYTVKYKR